MFEKGSGREEGREEEAGSERGREGVGRGWKSWHGREGGTAGLQ